MPSGRMCTGLRLRQRRRHHEHANMPSSTAEFVAEPRPEPFYVAAEAAFPSKSKLVNADYLRALGLLVLLQFKMDRRSLYIKVLGIT